MLYFTANPRDGISGASGNMCNSCCCQNIGLRPGETNLMQINYAPWSVPIGWISPTLEYSIEVDTASCPTAAIDGFGPPSNTFYDFTTPVNTALTPIDLTANASPAGNAFTYHLVPMTGPYNGVVVIVNGIATYTPHQAFVGFDHFWYEMRDAQGRSIRRSVVIKVGAAVGAAPREWTATMPVIDVSKIKTDMTGQMVSFPIFMPYTCQGCETYRLTIKQPATDCDRNIFHHFSCFDIRCKDC